MGLNESIYRLNGPHENTTQINLINKVNYFDVVGVTRLIAGIDSGHLLTNGYGNYSEWAVK